MSDSRERGIPLGLEIMRFPYKGSDSTVPVAPGTSELKAMVATRVVPGLEGVMATTPPEWDRGIAFVPYQYVTDQLIFSNPEAARQLIEMMRAAGLPIRDDVLENPLKLDPISPTRRELISHKRQFPDYYFRLKYFTEGTFFIGPLIAEPLPPETWFVVVDEEISRAQMSIGSTVAVHGETLLTGIGETIADDRIYYSEIVEYLDRVFDPHTLQ